MRKILSLCAAFGSFVLLLGAAGAQAQTTLSVSNWLPATHFFYPRVLQVWASDVERVTEGRVKVNILPKVVGTLTTQYDVAADGLADVVMFFPGYTPGRFDLTGIAEVPLLTEDTKVATVAFARFYEKELAQRAIFKEVHLLSVFTTTPGGFLTAGKPVTSADMLKGMKIRSPLPVTTALLNNLGAVPITKPVSEVYELLSSGVIDGGLAGYDQTKGFKLDEIAGGFTEVPGGMYNIVMAMAMNKAKWNSLSEADRKAISGISGETLSLLVANVYDEELKSGKSQLVGKGVPVAVADEKFVAAVRDASQPIYARIVDIAREAGVSDPDKILDRVRATIADVKKELGR